MRVPEDNSFFANTMLEKGYGIPRSSLTPRANLEQLAITVKKKTSLSIPVPMPMLVRPSMPYPYPQTHQKP